ncbi:hypothetical protein EP30_06755 [Bifidobacterium sp. UTCIF-39]|uniref:histidine kinase dimerization/phosphoacceptor domain-containing protein n=1 Tax=Bifidobacterium sp. UTCIF-39 TaxID=1465359 RepID=UPI00112A2F01|nr:histidine kinase dimerization/phosphoacceptor domain-containing protein [Bifidobacterium sp. UTCIF-39]TPF96574.1 hypothetical protein EP30_06755 [Bifidobacterium sp. UTCIF-39]
MTGTILRPWTMLLTVAGFVLVWFDDLYRCAYTGDMRYVAYAVIHVAVVLAYEVFPLRAGLIVPIIWLIGVVSPLYCPESWLALVAVVVGECAFIRPAIGIASVVVIAVAQMLDWWMHDGGMFHDVGGFLAVVLAIAAAAMIGVALRERERRIRLLSAMEYRRMTDAAVRQMHDYVANDLSAILAVVDVARHGERRPALDDIASMGEDALIRVREIIALLRNDVGSSAPARMYASEFLVPFWRILPDGRVYDTTAVRLDDVRDLVDAQQTLLQSLGFEGIVFVADESDAEIDGDLTLVRDLLREIFGNILKYADRESGYTMSVMVERQSIRVRVSDTPICVRRGDTAVVKNKNRSGRDPDAGNAVGGGLADYERRVNAVGGYWRCSLSAEEWSLDALVPLSRDIE